MKTLKSYDLQRGDWVLMPESDDKWHEVLEVDKQNVFSQPYKFAFGWATVNHKVEAVLRPSVIIRDKLDDSLEHVRSGEPYTSTDQWNVSLKEIHPKERKKSLKEKCSLNYPMDALDVFNAFHLLCEEIEELKKGDK